MIEQLLGQMLSLQVPPSLSELLIGLLVATVLSVFLAWHFVRFGRTYSNRRELAQVFTILVLATVLIISIVKTSVALSLGLVGALSIVRFRTPIKEPEELAYLFVAIGIGIGIGAGQVLLTASATVVILIVLMVRSSNAQRHESVGLLVTVEVPRDDPSDHLFRQINGFVVNQVAGSSLRRMDARDGIIQATYYVNCSERDAVIDLMEGLHNMLPQAAISFLEQDHSWGR